MKTVPRSSSSSWRGNLVNSDFLAWTLVSGRQKCHATTLERQRRKQNIPSFLLIEIVYFLISLCKSR